MTKNQNEGIYGEDAIERAKEILDTELASLLESAADDFTNTNGSCTIVGPGLEWELSSNDSIIDDMLFDEDPLYIKQMEEAYFQIDSVGKAYDLLITNEIDEQRIKILESLRASWWEDNK